MLGLGRRGARARKFIALSPALTQHRPMRICFFGDSFVNGTGDPDFLGWVGRVCARSSVPDLTAYNLGIRRDTTSDIAARWRDEATRRLPDEVDGRLVFSFGVNDAVQGKTDTLANARAILAEASAWKPTLMIGPAPIEDAGVNVRVAALSQSLGRLCAELGAPFLPVFDPLAASPLWMAEVASQDGAHPGANGYELLAGLVSGWSAWRDWVAR